MIVTTTQSVPGREIAQVLGITRGGTTRSRNVVQDMFAGVKNLVGGEMSQYTKLQADIREQALQRMVDDATRMGADAIVGVRFEAESLTQGALGASAYGTAVKLQ
ncbi:MAG: YbjQ family protein [Candidatus Spechtbacteria bacterium SB0662_bin_43]|uniref:UPF0145 protein F4X82_01410 n=1 Tax=Candidatus Spechtbacteria bacterium SB0662_bin_43 TaxID=2604897 RepID=A0A845DLG4_9BACT|nr:YbjQ family protein [Candidatus Spechtbacteria bacterium SB0662_bin_43]